MERLLLFFVCIILFSCKEQLKTEEEELVLWQPYNDSAEVAANQNHEKERMRYKHIQSKVLDKNAVFLPLYDEVSKFSEERYQALKPSIFEQNIFFIRKQIEDGKFTYKDLVLFYLYRIYKYELDNTTTLNTVIALNKEVVNQAMNNPELGIELQNVMTAFYNLPIINLIVAFILFFISGYLLYSSLYAAIGAAVDNETDTQQFMLPILMPLILAVYIGVFTVIEDPHGTVSSVFSFIPFTSPVVMLMRIPFGVPLWQQLVSLLLLIATFMLTVWFAAKIYRVGILMYGKKPSYKELLKCDWAF